MTSGVDTRSELMSRIRGTDTHPEMRLRKRLWSEGLRYRLKAVTPSGRPDLTFPHRRVAVFVDGCFWHGCPEHYVRPRSHSMFWSAKLAENVSRDRRQTLELEAAGWTVCRFWEHEIYENLDNVVATVRAAVAGTTRGRVPASWRVVEVVPLESSDNRERRFMEALRDSGRKRIVEQERSTKKW